MGRGESERGVKRGEVKEGREGWDEAGKCRKREITKFKFRSIAKPD